MIRKKWEVKITLKHEKGICKDELVTDTYSTREEWKSLE